MSTGKRARQILKTVIQLLIAPIAFAVLWALVAPVFHLPSLFEIGSAVGEMWRRGTYLHDILVSSFRGITGFLIGFLLGGFTGVVTGRYKTAYMLSGGLLLFLRWTPVLALLPLTIRIGGLGELPKIFLIAWACYFVSWTYTHVAVTKLNTDYVLWADSLGLRFFQRLFKIYVPAIAPSLIGGARVALALAMIVVVAAEFGGTLQEGVFREGLGYRISRAIETNRNDINIAVILTFGAIGTLYDFLLVRFFDGGLRRLTRIDFYRKGA